MSTAPTVDDAYGRWQVYRRLLRYVRPYRGQLVLAVLGMMSYAAADTAFAWLMKPMLDGSFAGQDDMAVKWVPLAIVGIFLLRGVGAFATTYLMSKVGWRVIGNLRSEVFDTYLNLPVRYFDHTPQGDLVARITYSAEQVSSAVTDSFTTLVRDSLSVIGLLGLMFWHSWQLALTFVFLGPILAVLVGLISRHFRHLGRAQQNSMGQLNQVLHEVLGALRVVRIHAAESVERKRFDAVNEQNIQQQTREALARAIAAPFVQFLVALALALIVYLATSDEWMSGVTVGAFMSFITAMLMLFQPLRGLTNINAALQKGMVAGENLFRLLDEPREPLGGDARLPKPPSDIRFADISFHYVDGSARVLDQVSFSIQPGQRVALVGASGSGKSTLANLLARLYRPEAGQIFADGVDIAQLDVAHWRAQLAYVGQDIALFHDSVRANVAYASKVDEARLWQALELARAREFVEALPEGIDSIIGSRGLMLSGGQRQRLAIARALYRRAPILILDEATSALDNASERAVQAGLETLMQDCTSLVIAHRLSTVERADKIIVLNAGRIVESGTHEQLLAAGGHYRALHAQTLNT